MKKVFLSLIVTFMLTNFSFSQEKTMTKTEVREYFSQKIFENFKKSNYKLFEKLASSNLKVGRSENKKIIYSNFENYYFFDHSGVILLGQINKSNINIFDLTNQKTTFTECSTNDDGVIKINDKSLQISNFSDSTTMSRVKPCADYAGFALCYTVTLASTASSGPLMAFTWGAGTAYCYYSHCR